MAEFQAGEVVVPVVPDAKGFLRDLKRQVLGPAVTKLGQDIGRQIMTGVQGRITPVKVDVQADTASVRTEISQLKAELAQLARGGATVEVDADTGGATSALAGLEAVLQRIAAQTARAQVDVDTGAAQAQLGAAEAALARVDGRTANARVDVDVDVAGALANIALVSAALTALPAAASVAVGLGGIAAAAGAAGIGIAGFAAIAAPSISRITEANKAAEKAQEAVATATGKVSTAAEDAAIAQYQQQIRTLQAAGAADQLRDAQERVKDAVAGVAAAQQRLQATVRSAAEAQAAAAERVSRAERGVVDAQRSALRAQQDLNEARRQAARDLEDLASNVANSRLDLRDAVLDEKDAEQALTRARQGGSSEEIARAEIAYERAKQRVVDLQRQVQRLGEEQLEADTKGVEGSDRVVAAKEAVEQANQRVLDQQDALSKAHADEAKAAEDAAQRIKDARKGVEDAKKRVDDAKEGVEAAKRARKIAELQEKIREEQEKKAAKQAAARPSAGGGAAKKDPMADLSPAAQAAAKEFKKFSDAYLAWQKKLEPAVLPAITGALSLVQKLFGPLTPIISGSAKALTGLWKAAEKALGGPFWQTFFKDLAVAAPKAITGLGKSFGNVITGIAGVVKAFLPFQDTVIGGIEDATAAFAEWGKNLGKSQGFQTFVAFVRENAPKVWSLITNIASAIAGLIAKLAPLGSAVMTGLASLAGVIAKMDPGTLQAIAIALGGIVLAVKLWSAAQTVLNMVLSKNPIGLIITAVSLLVAGITYLWQTNETFRNVVIAVWDAISTAVQWAWENVLKPIWDGMVWLWQNVLAPAATWLWQNVLKPAFEGIAAAVKWAWENVIKPALAALEWFFKNVIAPVVTWLWNNIVKPVWGYIGTAIKVAWERVILPALKALWAYLTETLAPKVLWLYNNIIKPTWDKVGSVIKTVWESVIKPAFGFLYDMIFKTIPEGFKKGVGFIETAWNKIKEVAKKPVEFIVNTVWNNGIVKVWNAAAKLLGLDELKPVAFARGGIYPGYTPGRDVGLAAVSGGEAIMRPEWTKAVGEDYVNSANAAARKGGVGGVARFLGVAGDPAPFMGAFSLGGIVDSALGILKDGVKVGAAKLLGPLLSQAQSAVGDSGWGKMLLAIPKTIVNGVLKLIGEKEGNGAKAVSFARQQLGKPYQWGATGPDSFDCSGLVLRALQSAGVSGVPRVTQDQIKWVKKVSTPMPGDLGFPHDGHVWMYSGNNRIIEAPYTGAHVREVAARAAQVIGRPPQWFDSGGYLMPGTSLVHNGTGRPEPVLTDQQWSQLSNATRGGDGGGDLNIETFNSYAGTSPQQIVDALSWRRKSRRGG